MNPVYWLLTHDPLDLIATADLVTYLQKHKGRAKAQSAWMFESDKSDTDTIKEVGHILRGIRFVLLRIDGQAIAYGPQEA